MTANGRTLIARLRARREYRTGKPIVLRFSLTNASARELAVLRRGTPLEGLITECLAVTRDGRPVRYEGIHVQRGEPEASEYLYIAPGQQIDVAFNIADSYRMSAGRYRIRFNAPIEAIVGSSSSTPSTLRADRRSGRARRREVGAGASFDVVGSGRALLTKAQKFAEVMAAAAAIPVAAPGAVLPPVLNGGDASRRTVVQNAHVAAADLCDRAAQVVASGAQPPYEDWFGQATLSRVQRVASTFQHVSAEFRSKTINYDLIGYGCASGWWAYTIRNTPGAPNIHLCDEFWKAPEEGLRSKPGTIVHELTHAVAGTEDFAEDIPSARALASAHPDQATKCAASHQYFAESLS